MSLDFYPEESSIFRDDKPTDNRGVNRRLCDECGEMRTIPSHWARKICVSCRDGDPILKRCSRCGLHKPHPKRGWTQYNCPDCSRESSRLYRARLKEQGKTTLKIAACSKCGVESECPQGRICRPCGNLYQREWRKAHPEKKLVYARLGHEPMVKCSHCREWFLYAEKIGWRGGVCGRCAQRYRVKAQANRKAQLAEWRETGAMVTCTTCGVASAYGTGWSIRVCPSCVAVYSKAQQEAVAADPERLAHRRAMRREAARKRREKSHGGVSGTPSPTGDE